MKAFIFTACICLLCSSCLLFYNPAFVLQFHEFSDPQLATNLLAKLKTPNFNSTHVVKKYPFLNSRGICNGEMVGPDAKGKYALRLQVDKWSARSLNQYAGNYYGMAYAINLDGVLIGASHFNQGMRDSNVFETDYIFTKHDATMIVSRIAKNYEYFNRRY